MIGRPDRAYINGLTRPVELVEELPLRVAVGRGFRTVSVICYTSGNVRAVLERDIANTEYGLNWLATLVKLFNVEHDRKNCLYRIYDRKEPSQGIDPKTD